MRRAWSSAAIQGPSYTKIDGARGLLTLALMVLLSCLRPADGFFTTTTTITTSTQWGGGGTTTRGVMYQKRMVVAALEPSHEASRQDVLRRVALTTLGVWTGGVMQGRWDAQAAPSGLQSRMNNDIIKSPGVAGMGSPTLVLLPKWLKGTWNTTMEFVDSRFPLGEKYVSPQIARSVEAVAAAKEVNFPLRFYSMIPDTPQNTMRVVRGEEPLPEVVPDRAYNTRSVIEAYYGYPAVGEISYNMSTNPLRMQILFSTVGPDMQPLPRRRQELFINNIQFESPDENHYICSEFIRTVSLRRAVSVTDSETLTEYDLKPDGEVVGNQRVAIYLTPNPNNQEGAMYFETGGKAVALFDYRFRMRRTGDGTVLTPERNIQYISQEEASRLQ